MLAGVASPPQAQDPIISETMFMDYLKIYNAIISKRKSEPLKPTSNTYTELHHITPRCLGGSDLEENLVRLTGREHFIAHRLLSKIYPGSRGLTFAIFSMCNIQGRRVPSKTYEMMRKRYRESASESMFAINSDPDYALNKSKNTSRQWEDTETRCKMLAGLAKSWEGNEKRRKLSSEDLRERMKCPVRLAHSMNNAIKMQGDSTWDSMRSRKSGTRPFWGLAGLLWRLSEFNPDNKERPVKAVEFSRIYDCGQRSQLYQNMIAKFRKGWIPHNDPIWMRDFGDEF